ncbi:tRNA (guanine-N(7)-)-methyltransferase-like isoform X1 [Zingiber officinale]|uniref:tRNA (guanine-N(7)-)-methyltransferase-like isoform X1 n=1 Tax=Zingiber officinale TaxID=94328 RepID=UPI001C4B45CE|nr:tRNA (guanine-N(7)-)-methyltransferase-like isoform X1 [Zingiber officinale]
MKHPEPIASRVMLGVRWSGCGLCAAHVLRWPTTATSYPSPLLDPTTFHLRRRFLNLSGDSSGGRSWLRCPVTNEVSSVAARSTEVIEMEYADLNLKDFYGVNPQLGHLRIRQHVNPLSSSFSAPAEIPDWKGVFRDATLPLMVDIGSGSGRFLLWLAKNCPETRNYLGLEIRQKLVQRSQFWVKELRLKNIIVRHLKTESWHLHVGDTQGRETSMEVLSLLKACLTRKCSCLSSHFMFANAMVSFESLVASYPGPLTLVSILVVNLILQCPDPHFKKKHHKRRVLQEPLVNSIAENLSRGGTVFVQSDVLEVALDMRNQFDDRPDIFSHVNVIGDKPSCDSQGWVLHNPMGIRTEREIHAKLEGARIYRRIYEKVK